MGGTAGWARKKASQSSKPRQHYVDKDDGEGVGEGESGEYEEEEEDEEEEILIITAWQLAAERQRKVVELKVAAATIEAAARRKQAAKDAPLRRKVYVNPNSST